MTQQQTGQMVPFAQRFQDVKAQLEKRREEFRHALPSGLNPDRFLRMAMTAIRKMPDLVDCDRASFMGALVECAQLGLEPNTVLGHAYLIPFKNRRAGRLECQLIAGYRGLVKLAYQSGMVLDVDAQVVRKGDLFDYEYGDRPFLRHRPHEDQDRPMTHVYATVRIKGMDERKFRVLTVGDCERIRDVFSARGKNGPWGEHFEPMSMKTALRQILKFVPSDTERSLLARMVSHDERAESRDPIPQEFEADVLAPPEVPEGEATGEATPAEPPAEEKPLDKLARAAKEKQAKDGAKEGPGT